MNLRRYLGGFKMKRAIEIIKASVIEAYGDKEADIFAVGLVQKLEEEGLM